jgi:hypothetical protein
MRERLFILAFLLLIAGEAVVQSLAEIMRGEFPDALNVLRSLPTDNSLRAFERGLERNSVVGTYLRPRLRGCLSCIFGSTGNNALAGRDGWLYFKPGAAASVSRIPVGADSPAQAVIATTQLQADLRLRGIRLLPVLVPNKESVHPESLWCRSDPAWRPAATREFIAGCRAAGVPLLDLHAELVLRNATTAVYMQRDSHWSRDGILVAAQAIAGRMDTQPNTMTRLRETEVVLLPDLIRSQNIKWLCEEPFNTPLPAWQVVDRDSGSPALGLSDDADVLIIGDSFLGTMEVDSPQATGFTAHLAHSLGKPVSVLSIPGGGATLVRKKLAGQLSLLRNKRWVIWEFVERDLSMATEGWPVVRIPDHTEPDTGLKP